VPLAGAAACQAADCALEAATQRAAAALSAGDTGVAVYPLAPGAAATPSETFRPPSRDPPPLDPRASPGPCSARVLRPVPLLCAPAVALDGDGSVWPAGLSRVPSAPASAASAAQPYSSPAVWQLVAVRYAAPLAGTPVARGLPAVFVPAHGAAAVAGAAAARASAAARAVGETAAVERGDARMRKRPAPTMGSLEATLHGGVDAWAGSKRPRAKDLGGSFIRPVPQQVLDNASTTKATLQDLCRERTIAFGDTDSEQSLRTSLRRLNASSTTV